MLTRAISEWVYLYYFVEASVTLHMASHLRASSAVQNGGLQWIVYCWLLFTKIYVFYFHLMPVLDYEEMRALVSSLCLTPVLYLVLTTRTLQQLFDQSEKWEGGTTSKSRREHVTLDVVLLQDMVWHVVIDMIDMLNVMFLARPEDPKDGIGQSLIDSYPSTVRNISRTAGVFACLGFLFHQQSFPSISFAAAGTGFRDRDVTRSGMGSFGTSSLSSAGETDVIHTESIISGGTSNTVSRVPTSSDVDTSVDAESSFSHRDSGMVIGRSDEPPRMMDVIWRLSRCFGTGV